MRLTQQNLAHYLIDKGFLSAEYPVNGQYLVIQQQSRNSIFEVKLGQQPSGLFVKQLQSLDSQNGYLMQKEATAHYFIHKTEVLEALKPFVPEYFGYDPSCHVLVTQCFIAAKNLQELIMSRKHLEHSEAAVLAQILAAQHQDLSEHIDHVPSLQFFNRQIPWVLQLGETHHPTFAMTPQFSGPVAQSIRQQPLITTALEKLRVNWQGNTLIHGDIKLANFIVLPDEGSIKLIDWEISDLGDPLWDVAGLIQSLLSTWLLTFDPNPALVQQQPGFESLTSEQLINFIHQFWTLYCRDRDDPGLNTSAQRTKLIEFTAARMLQTAFESNMQSSALSTHASRIMQYCQSLFADPEQMATQLLGAPSHGA